MGTLTAAALVEPIPFDGAVMLLIDFTTGLILGTGGSKAGEALGEELDKMDLENSLSEAGIEVIWE